MKNLTTKLLDVRLYIPTLAKILLILVVAFTFTAGAAMGFDEAVTHQKFGLTSFILGVLLTFIWMVDASLKGIVKSYSDYRKEETVIFMASIIYASLAFISLLFTFISLGIH